MEIDLNIARSAFDAREATTSEGLHDTVRGVDEVARRWLDEFAVRLHLAGRESDDRAQEIQHRLDRARGEVQWAAARIEGTLGSDLGSMRSIALDTIREVRAAMENCVNGIFHYVE
jgi:hypothetical protein